ncbi:MAG: hypothetical protein HC820_09995, partial [Hydrococcus sp. RM1_1_31]|nr:hypothetical protein [Hydrococcus sp. RM1_1_31]
MATLLTTTIKKDFQGLLAQLDWSWDVPTHPAYQYLFSLPQPPNHKKVFFGAFPTNPPDDYQASALKHALDYFLTAVIGP